MKFSDKPPTVTAQVVPYYPYWLNEIQSENLKDFYSKNGHLSLIKKLQVEVVSNLDACHTLWELFSPKKNLFDTWEFRLAFHRGYNYKPHFVTLKTNDDIHAVLPLWFEDDLNRYCFFGSVWQEENIFLVKDPMFVPLLLSVCPSPVYLNALSEVAHSQGKDFEGMKTDDPKFILNLETITTLDEFLSTLKKKRRYNVRRDKRIIEAQNPQIIIDDFSYFDILVKLCVKRFEEKGEETDWDDSRRYESFKQVVELGKQKKSYSIRMITIKIGDKVAAVDLIALYNDCYYPLKCGYDVRHFPGIGSYMNLFEIEDALQLGMKKMDFLEVDYGWKNKWFEQVPLFKFEKDYNSDEIDE